MKRNWTRQRHLRYYLWFFFGYLRTNEGKLFKRFRAHADR